MLENNLKPNRADMLSHLKFLFDGQESGQIEIAFTPPGSGAVNNAEWFSVHNLDAAADFAYETNSKTGVNVYIGAALRHPEALAVGRSSIADYYAATALWVDMDDSGVAAAARDKYKQLPPSFVVVTGRHPDLRAQAWWKLDTPQSDHSIHKHDLAHICAYLGGDKSVVDSARVMRLGGSIAWPKKEGRVPELTEIKIPAQATNKVAQDSFKSYFPIASPLLTQKLVIGEVDHERKAPRLSIVQDREWSADDVKDMLSYINPDNDYIDWVKIGMGVKDYGLSFDVWDSWSASGSKYPGESELYKKWQSFKGTGVSIGSIYYYAKQNGYTPEQKDELRSYAYKNVSHELLSQSEDEFDPVTGELVARDPIPLPTATEQPQKRVLPLLYADDVTPVMDTSDFVEDMLRDREFSVVYGESNCGKTFFMLDMAMHVALGLKWRDKEVEQGAVIYAALEGGHGTRNRIAAFKEYHKIDRNIPLAVIPSAVNFLDSNGDMIALVEAVRQAQQKMGNVRLIVIDTLARAISGGDENSSTDMGQLIINADLLREITGAHICFIHHSGKDAVKKARGHSSLRAAVDTEIEISRDDTNSPSMIKVVKQREMEMIEDMAFTLKSVTLGVNNRMKNVTSCIVIEDEVRERADRDVKLTANEQFVYDAVTAAIIDQGKPRNIIPNSPPITSIDYWELATELQNRGSKDMINEDNKNNVKSITEAARKSLKKKGKINFNLGYVWLTS